MILKVIRRVHTYYGEQLGLKARINFNIGQLWEYAEYNGDVYLMRGNVSVMVNKNFIDRYFKVVEHDKS